MNCSNQSVSIFGEVWIDSQSLEDDSTSFEDDDDSTMNSRGHECGGLDDDSWEIRNGAGAGYASPATST